MAKGTFPLQSQPVPSGVGIGTYDAYADAQRAVDFLSDAEFPVQYVTIVGNDLRMVERVTGRLTQNRVALGGAVGGAWWGLFIGTILLLFGSGSEYSGYLLVLLTVLVGAVFGAVFALIGYAATRGRRDFTSTSSVVATSYEVLCQHAHADAARQVLGRLPVNR
ncbi:MAG: hypothetical protein AVDCRST_MAG29-776 [uncultured Nocardioidaceae bacterium]|uniref:General stress protein 17M-like domain-containing protein n=1 Tax=uncultured Nocardioidaceae bacterium TaxID=253824 RepID=A0A6J4LAA7_9ACTN|nr:MAG: hypothetical protein AVDCRST_MAG29-776 [uncultured Nocardioidaceae bacterium]